MLARGSALRSSQAQGWELRGPQAGPGGGWRLTTRHTCARCVAGSQQRGPPPTGTAMRLAKVKRGASPAHQQRLEGPACCAAGRPRRQRPLEAFRTVAAAPTTHNPQPAPLPTTHTLRWAGSEASVSWVVACGRQQNTAGRRRGGRGGSAGRRRMAAAPRPGGRPTRLPRPPRSRRVMPPGTQLSAPSSPQPQHRSKPRRCQTRPAAPGSPGEPGCCYFLQLCHKQVLQVGSTHLHPRHPTPRPQS